MQKHEEIVLFSLQEEEEAEDMDTLSPNNKLQNSASPKCTFVDLIIATTMFFKPQKTLIVLCIDPVVEEICHINPTCTRFPPSLTYSNNGDQKRMEPGFSSVLASAKTSIELCKYPGILRQSDSPDDQQGVREVTIPSHAIGCDSLSTFTNVHIFPHLMNCFSIF